MCNIKVLAQTVAGMVLKKKAKMAKTQKIIKKIIN